jgi:SP family arabinose:H+ symporter-like MFS transporter
MTDTAKPASAAGESVLAALDSQAPSSLYWYLALLACVGGFLFGYDTADIGSALPFLPYHLSDFAVGYLVAGASIGAAVGALAAGPLTDRFGRKSLLIADVTIYAVGAIVSALAINAPMLLGARTLIGLAIGADSAIATAYIAEFAPRSRRGALSLIQQWMITVGILGSYIVALVILRVAPGAATSSGWRLILGLGALPAIVGVVLRARMPESPRWLMEKGRAAQTTKALKQLGVEVSPADVRRATDELSVSARERKRSGAKVWTPGVRRALLLVCAFFILQQITGINVPFYYGPRVLSDFFKGPSSDAVSAAIAGVEVTAILGTVNVLATYLGFRWIDKRGRRPLAIGGFIGMMTFILVAAVGVAFMTGVPKTVVVMIGFSFFISSFAIGVGGTGWLIQGEYFPTEVRGTAAAIAAAVDWLANFAIIEAFPTLNQRFGLAWVMVGFAALALIAVVFVARFIPETKGMSVEKVVGLLERRAMPKRRRG